MFSIVLFRQGSCKDTLWNLERMNVEIGYIGEMGYIEGEGVIQAAEELLEYRRSLQSQKSWLVGLIFSILN